jgi:TonB family protein
MNIPEEFGSYLLLKKLSEDGLGETFRAGKLGKDGLEQVVLLRVFNGKGLDGEKLWSRMSGRSAVFQALRSPNIGSGADLGKVRNYPYTAYDYISGKNLAALLERADKQGSPIPADHALLIAERLALALSAAAETRVQEEKVLHGFLVPHLAMISNEGETRLLGFEAAPGLRELAAAGWQDRDLVRYLAPELRTGGPLHKSDDVYSLGVILFELLTGERLPAGNADGHAAAIDAAVQPYDGTPIAAPVAALLKKSLAPRDGRVGDAATWHKTLSKLMIEGHYNPTTFNLAFFMHSLFRDEIERESQEIQAERKLKLPDRTAAASVATAAASSAATVQIPAFSETREKTGVREATLPGVHPYAAPAAPASRKGLYLAAAAVVVAALGAGAYFLFLRGDKPAPAAQQAALPAPVPVAPVGTEPAVPAGPTQEELQAQIQAMFEARSQEMEDKLKGTYDQRIKDLQRQLEDSRRAEQEPVRPAAQPPVPRVEPAEAKTPPRPEPAAATESNVPPVPAAQPAVNTPAPSPPPAAVPSPVARPAEPAPAPRQAQVQVGDLVSGGPGVVRPQITRLPDPRYPTAARRMNKSASVDLKVLVDERGEVVQAERVGAKVGFGFDEAAVDAARRATFRPATKDGVRVKMWTSLRVTFQP